MEDRDPIVTEVLLTKLGHSFDINKARIVSTKWLLRASLTKGYLFMCQVKKSAMSGTDDSNFVNIFQLRLKS